MIQKKCKFCSWCLKNYPDELDLMLYPQSMKACPRCKDTEHELIDSNVWPRYVGAPVAAKPKPQKNLFSEDA